MRSDKYKVNQLNAGCLFVFVMTQFNNTGDGGLY